MLKFLRGGALIGAVIGRVEKYIEHLERGIAQAYEAHCNVNERIADLEQEAQTHLNHVNRGRSFVNKLRVLIED